MSDFDIKSLSDLVEENFKFQDMIIVYQEHIEVLEKENEKLKEQIIVLQSLIDKELLEDIKKDPYRVFVGLVKTNNAPRAGSGMSL